MINKTKVKNQLAKAINQLPTSISLKRIDRVGTQIDYEMQEVDVATFDAFIDTSGGALIKVPETTGEGGELLYVGAIRLYAVWSDSFSILKDDYFSVGAILYRVVQAIPNFEIYWDCGLEEVPADTQIAYTPAPEPEEEP